MKIAVFLGGESVERVVSLASGDAVAGWLADAGHEVTKYDPARPSEKFGARERLAPEQIGTVAPLPKAQHGFSAEIVLGILDFMKQEHIEFVFPVLHGGWGEDGTLQSLLDWVGAPYACSGALASGMAMHKQIARTVMSAAGVPVARGFAVRREQMGDSRAVTEEIKRITKFPCVIKPLSSGSAVGVTIVHSPEEVAQGLNTVIGQGDVALVEAYFKGRELTATVVNSQAYPLIEIRPRDGFYDYANKYTSGRTEYLCPAPISQEVTERIKRDAEAAFRSLGCRGCARIDFLLNDQDEHICLEVNTIPGMTGTSLVPKAAAAQGETPVELMQKILTPSLAEVGILS